MTTALALLALIGPFAVAAALARAAHRAGHLRLHLGQFQLAAPMAGRLFEGDRDLPRIEHDLDAVRTRFEPDSGTLGQRH